MLVAVAVALCQVDLRLQLSFTKCHHKEPHALSIPPMPIRNLCQEILGRRAAPGGIGCKQSAGVGKQSSRVIAEREVSEGGRE